MKRSARAFSLIEILVAVSIFAMMATLLLSISGQAANIWRRQMDVSSVRERARAALERIGAELQSAVMPVDAAANNSVQLVVNPSGVDSVFQHRDALFWFAPLATVEGRGNLAAVGYFVREIAGRRILCRFYVPSGDADFLLYSQPQDWVNNDLLTRLAPGDEASKFKGLFLEDVAGMWVDAYDEAGQPVATPPDTRTDGRLPARIDVSLVFLDGTAAEQVRAGVTLPDAASAASAQAFLDAAPESLQAHMEAISISVSFRERRK